MIESQIASTDILYDMHNTVFKRWGRHKDIDKAHLVDGLSYNTVKAIQESTEEELESRMVKVSFQPDFYYVQEKNEFVQKQYQPIIDFFKINKLNAPDYKKLFWKYYFPKHLLLLI